jgi:thiosulfate reductase cytochrome b subunit
MVSLRHKLPSKNLADEAKRHSVWIRVSHWLIAISVITLMYSGAMIFMVHPRLYWGTVGNDLTKPLVEISIGPNQGTGNWSTPKPFFNSLRSPVTAMRLREPWNENSWARSTHFLAAWFLVFGLLTYILYGVFTGHFRRRLLPSPRELAPSNLWDDIRRHIQNPAPDVNSGLPYQILQKLSYMLAMLVALPLIFLTGLTMSPAITADYPILLDIFNGTQSARTIHFMTFAFLVLFLTVHVVMVMRTGPLRHLRAMTRGN